jgi:hypothetical protein
MPQRGGIEGITRRISEAVKRNCGQKAIVIAHSYGANVMATIFQKPELQKWRWGGGKRARTRGRAG